MNRYNRWRLEMYLGVYESYKAGRISYASVRKIVTKLLKEGPPEGFK